MVLELIDIKDKKGQKFEKILCCKYQDSITNKRLKYYDEKFFRIEDIKQWLRS